MVRMLRTAALILLVGLCAVSAGADASQPIGYTIEARIEGGRLLPDGAGSTGAYLLRDRAPWDPGSAVVLRLHGTSTVRSSALDGAEILAAMVRKGGLIAVLHDTTGHTIVTIDSMLQVTSRSMIPVHHRDGQTPTARIIGMAAPTTLLVIVGSTLCSVDITHDAVAQVRVIEHGVSGGAVIALGELRSCYVHQVGAGAVLAVTDSALRVRAFAPVPRAMHSRIEQCGSRIAVLTPIGDNKATQVTLVDPRTSRTEYATVDAPVDVVTAFERDSTVMIALVRTLDDRYELVVRAFGQVNDLASEPIGERLTIRYFQPLVLRRSGETLYLLFSGGLFTASLYGEVRSSDDLPNDAVGLNAEALPVSDRLVLRGDRGSLLLSKDTHPFWFAVRVAQDTGRYAVPIVLLLILGILLLRYRRQHRLLDAMMDLPGSGMVIWIDPNGKLVRANQSASVALGITPSVPMRRLIQYYLQNAALRELLDFTSAVQATRAAMSEKVAIQLEGASREYVFSSVPLRTTVGRYLGAVITGVDITEALERKRLVNWAQLAHDMQTNLSTIRLNAEQLEDATPQNVERRRRILYQVGILIHRVRDLVAVGRSDELDRSMVHSAELCTEIRHEFDHAVFPHVTFSMKLRGTMMVVDRQKITRAIRNAVENGIKAMRGEPGVIEMATWFDRSNVYIRISDTGVGMDAATLQNMMKPYFTTAHDGGGTGIGTMIMQHVVHAHGGSLRVTSEPGKGTQVIFRIPHGMEPLRKRSTEDMLEEVA